MKATLKETKLADHYKAQSHLAAYDVTDDGMKQLAPKGCTVVVGSTAKAGDALHRPVVVKDGDKPVLCMGKDVAPDKLVGVVVSIDKSAHAVDAAPAESEPDTKDTQTEAVAN